MNGSKWQHCIEAKPSFNLKDCLAYYDNQTLIDLADKQHMLVEMEWPTDANPKTLNRKVLLKSLYNKIDRHFEEDLFYLPPREIEFVSKLMAADFNVADTLDYEDCSFLHALGYVHLYNYKGKIYPVIPKELREIYKGIPKNELDDERDLNNGFYSYAIALTQIHGIYTIEHFIEVWNKYHESKTDFEEMVRYFDMMYDRQNYFSFDYQYIVTHYPSIEDGYKLLEGNRDKRYRIPEKTEIETFFQGRLGEESPYFEELARLI